MAFTRAIVAAALVYVAARLVKEYVKNNPNVLHGLGGDR